MELRNLTLGRVLKFSGGSFAADGLVLLSVAGLSAAEYSLDARDSALLDGSAVAGAKITARKISIRADIDDYSAAPQERERLLHFFSPRHEYTLRVRRGTIRRRIGARVQAFSSDPSNLWNYYGAEIDLLCPDPFFEDESDTTLQFRLFEPLINFPLIFIPQGAGLTTAIQVVTDSMTVNNDGDADFGIEFTAEVVGGNIVNPAVWNNDSYVRVLTTLRIGDTLKIDTRRGRKGIWVNGVKFMRYDPTSTWFTLKPGANQVSFRADSGAEKAIGSITYSNRWFGV